MESFNELDFRGALTKLGVEKGSIIYITGNLGKIGAPSLFGKRIKNKQDILKFYLNGILDFIGENGTIVFPTHTWNLVRSNIPFDPEKTPTHITFSEYIRNKLPVKRQIHPFASICAYGKYANSIISDEITRHPYGINSPYEFLAKNKCIFISLGMPARRSIAPVHYCEFKAGIPYRYTKSFKHKILINGKYSYEEFFLFVCYNNVEILRDQNDKIFSLEKIRKKTLKADLGNSFIESISLDYFINETLSSMLNDPYIWVKEIKSNSNNIPWLK